MKKSVSDIPFKKSLELELFRHYKSAEARKHQLSYLFWECTLRCTMSCLHCGSECQTRSGVPDMPYKDFLKIADSVAGVYNPNEVFVCFTGGEPLLRDDIEKCGLELFKRGFPWGIVTNALLLTEDRFDSLANSGMHSISISLDGLEKSHNWLRQNDNSFKMAVKALRYGTRFNGITLEAITCVTQKNITELEQIKKLLISLGIRRWRVFDIFAKGRACETDLLRITSNQLKYLMDFIVAVRKEGIIDAQYGCDGFLGSFENVARRGFMFCRAGINVASVLADGSISACPSLRADYIQGNIYKDDFVKCWQSRFEVMRNRSWTRTGQCKSCEVYNWCEGNGLHLRDEKTGKLLMCQYEMLK